MTPADQMTTREVREHLERLNLSQGSFGKALGHPKRTVERWCGGELDSPSTIPNSLARLLRVADRGLIERLRAAGQGETATNGDA